LRSFGPGRRGECNAREGGSGADALLASFERDKGKEITVEFRSGAKERLRVVGVGGGKVTASQNVSGGSVERSFGSRT